VESNLDCHYCWAFDNRVKGMTEDVARRSIDWLHFSPDVQKIMADYWKKVGFNVSTYIIPRVDVIISGVYSDKPAANESSIRSSGVANKKRCSPLTRMSSRR
jgi:hypothetical protein